MQEATPEDLAGIFYGAKYAEGFRCEARAKTETKRVAALRVRLRSKQVVVPCVQFPVQFPVFWSVVNLKKHCIAKPVSLLESENCFQDLQQMMFHVT